ncbi:MAG TPA: hypothetical protein VJ743_10210 [Albitalea sp.]|nr:hypothetical protein [Albitalea sp.]
MNTDRMALPSFNPAAGFAALIARRLARRPRALRGWIAPTHAAALGDEPTAALPAVSPTPEAQDEDMELLRRLREAGL